MTGYIRYSHHARRALTHASTLGERYGHPAIDTGHLLVGILRTSGSIGWQVLLDMRIQPDQAEAHLLSLYDPSTYNPDETDYAEALDALLGLAAVEASWLGQVYIGTEHFLMSMTRTNLGNVGTLLHLLDVSTERLSRQLRRALKDGPSEFNLHLAKRAASFSELTRRVINAAEQMAVALDSPTVGLGHLLLVLLMENRSPTAGLLRDCGLDEERLRTALDAHYEPLLASIEDALNGALENAQSMGSHYTGTEHLLLTLMIDPVGIGLLREFGANPDAVRRRLDSHLKSKR